jgi:hypothetical protein
VTAWCPGRSKTGWVWRLCSSLSDLPRRAETRQTTTSLASLRARWVGDGKYLTTAGVSAGIDGGLHLAARLVGEDAAKLVQLGLEHEPEPPFGPIDWDPAVTDALRPIWRGPLEEVVVQHPHLDRHSALQN